ncbi:hypothetical protein CDA38_17410, partial [Klebsiella pneumoniae]|uniref:hypothetical protein n=1 Tax=Klebsiella pneumoniae TaxID=573 RepID=UPI000BD583E2
LQSPFAAQAQKLVDDNATFTPALHTLFLQRWRLSLVVQATSLNQLQSPFAAQAQKLVDDNATFTPALHTL